MNKLKVYSQMSEEEILNQKTLNYADVPNFISFYNIEPGTNDIKTSIIYDLYKRWSKEPITELQFFLFFSKFFTKRTKLGGTFYKLNSTALELASKRLKPINKKYEVAKFLKNKKWRESLEEFFKEQNITKGNNWTTGKYLFDLYNKKPKLQMNNKAFYRLLEFYFEYKNVKGTPWFKTNINEEKEQ
jgi:hypothetical protein